MKVTVVVFAMTMMSMATGLDYYDSDLDRMNADVLILNREAVDALHGCFMDTKPCGELAGKIRKLLPEAIMQACARCTKAQKHSAHVFTQHMKNDRPELYRLFNEKYDPDSKYIEKFEEQISIAE